MLVIGFDKGGLADLPGPPARSADDVTHRQCLNPGLFDEGGALGLLLDQEPWGGAVHQHHECDSVCGWGKGPCSLRKQDYWDMPLTPIEIGVLTRGPCDQFQCLTYRHDGVMDVVHIRPSGAPD